MVPPANWGGWVWFRRIGGGSINLPLSLFFWIVLLPPTLLFLLLLRATVQFCLNLVWGRGRFILASGIDAVFAHDQTKGSSSAPHMLLVGKGDAPNIHLLRDRFSYSVFTRSGGSGQPLYASRLQSTFIPNMLGWPVWERFQSFRIQDHVKLLDDGVSFTEEALLSRMGAFLGEGRVGGGGRPQWEVLLIPDYIPRQGGGSHWAILVRLHHAYGDGASFLLLLDQALGDEKIHWTLDPRAPHPQHPWTAWVGWIRAYLLGVAPFLRTLLSAMREDSPFLCKEGYSEEKFLDWSQPLPLDFFKELKAASGYAFSSIILTAFCGAARKLHLRKGLLSSGRKDSGFRDKTPPPSLNVGVVSAMIPFKHGGLQNSFSTYSVPCPLGERDVDLRLRGTDFSLRAVSQRGEPLFNHFIMRLTGLLPRRVMDALLSVAGTPVLFSNIPGPRLPPRLFGCDVVQMGGWIPLIKSYGMAVTVMSSCGVVRLCLSVDSSLISSSGEMDKFLGDLEAELELLGRIYRLPTQALLGKGRRNKGLDSGDKRTTA